MSAGEASRVRVDNGHVRVESTLETDGLALHFTGDANMDAVEPLAGLLKEVHQEAVERQAKRVVVDIRALRFMNSSCLKSFVTWLHDARNLEADRRYAVHFLTRPGVYWQSRSLPALRAFAPEIVSIEEPPPASGSAGE